MNQQGPVDRDLLLEFFLVFARAEFALKNSGYAKASKYDDASPDWDSFAKAIEKLFKKERTNELKSAVEYILLNPPMKQVLKNNSLMWDSTSPNGTETEVLFLLVRRIRNNLFHGGKYNVMPFEDTDRTTRLLTGALLIIYEGLSLLPNVQHTYDQAAI